MNSLPEMVTEAKRLSGKIDEGVKALTSSARKAAECERDYRLAKAQAWHVHVDGTAKEREAQVDAATADLRYARDLADAGRQAALEALRSRRAQASLLQSLLSAQRTDMEFHTYQGDVR